MKTIQVGDKFRLLDEVWTVIAIPLYETQFLSVTIPDQDESQDIWLDLSKADKLEWLDEEKPGKGNLGCQRCIKKAYSGTCDCSTCQGMKEEIKKKILCEGHDEERLEVKPRFVTPETKSEIMKEVLEMVADAWKNRGNDTFEAKLKRKAREI